MRAVVFGVGVILVAVPALAQDIGLEIRTVYSFAPHELTSQEIGEKTRVLDSFWAKAKTQKDTYLPAIRSELARPEARPFFLYDGSLLLLSLSDTGPDRQLSLGAIARCDLRDVRHTAYFLEVHRLASLGEDTTEAAFHILVEPKFTAFIPQHVLTLGQNYALVYMLLPTDPARWLAKTLTRLANEKEPTAQRSLLLLAWYAQTNEADAAITAFSADSAKPEESRRYARELLSRNGSSLLAAVTSLFQSEEALRSERRELMKRVSDEALLELDQKTAQIMAKRR